MKSLTTRIQIEIPHVVAQDCMTVGHDETAKNHLITAHLIQLQSLPAAHHLDEQPGKMRGRGRVTER